MKDKEIQELKEDLKDTCQKLKKALEYLQKYKEKERNMKK